MFQLIKFFVNSAFIIQSHYFCLVYRPNILVFISCLFFYNTKIMFSWVVLGGNLKPTWIFFWEHVLFMCAMIYHFLCSSLFLAPSIILEVCNVSPYIQIVQAYSLCFYIHIKTHLLCYILFCSCTTYILLKNKFIKELVGLFFCVGW